MVKTTKPRILDFTCPACDAEPEHMCTAASTNAAGVPTRYPTNPHKARRALWIEAKS